MRDSNGVAPIAQLRERAETLMFQGHRGAEVIAANAEILTQDPSDLPARTRLGFAYRVVGDFDSAQAIYTELLERAAPDSFEWRAAEQALSMIPLERERGGPAPSLPDQLAATKSPEDALMRARVLRDHGRADLADRWADRALELASGRGSRTRALAVKASILRRLERPTAALEVVWESLELDPSYTANGPAHRLRAACLVDLMRTPEAIAVVEAHLEADRDDAYAMNVSGRALKAMFRETGELTLQSRAEACFRRAVELEPGLTEATGQLRQMIEEYRRAKQPAKAADLELFLAGLGSNPVA